MSDSKFNARNGLSVGTSPTSVIDNTGNITAANITAANVSISGNLVIGGNTVNPNNALNVVTTAGDLIVGTGANTVTRLGIGANTYVLTSDGITANWNASSTQVYPGAGIPNSTGTAWGTSYSTTGSGNVVLGTGANIAATNLSVTNTITGNITGSAATVTAAAQTAITSVGTLSGLTVTSTITGSITGTAAGSVNKTGDTMSGNLAMGTNQVTGLPSIPGSPDAAASKAYVDALVLSGATWISPIDDPDLNDVVSVLPGAPVNGATYIAYGGTYPQNWGTGATAVVSGDIVARKQDGTAWIIIKNLTVGDRILLASEHGTVSATLLANGFYKDDLAQYVSGNPALTASWTFPSGRGNGGAPEIVQGITTLVSQSASEHIGHTYLYDATGNKWLEVAGPGTVGDGIGLSYSGTTLNVNLGAGVAQLPSDEVGIDVWTGGGLMTTTDGGNVSSATNAQLSLTNVGTAGTYTSVTTDGHGRVTAGTNPTPPLASVATVANTVAVTAVTTNSSFYPAFVSTTTGDLAVDVGTGLTFNPNTNTLSTTTFSGNVTGNINKVSITQPTTSATLTIADTKTFTVNNTVTLTGTDATSLSLPSVSTSIAGAGVSTTFTKPQIGSVSSLSVSANAIAVDMSLANNFAVTLQATTSQVLSNPTNATAGQAGQIAITQNGTPSTLTFGVNWISTDGTTPTVSTTASAVNLLTYYVVDSTHVWFAISKHGVA